MPKEQIEGIGEMEGMEGMEGMEELALDVESVEDAGIVGEGEGRITYGSNEWTSYVMGLFEEKDLVNGSPTADACRRMVEVLFGPIVETTVKEIKIVPTIGPKSEVAPFGAVVSVRIGVHICNEGMEEHPAFDSTVWAEDVAETTIANSPPFIARHSSAASMTKAEGRVYRKLLRLTGVLTAEELVKPDESPIKWEPPALVSADELQGIKLLCQSVNVNMMELVNSGSQHFNNPASIDAETAKRVMAKLNAIQQGQDVVPDGVGHYEEIEI